MAIAPDRSHRDVPSWTFVVFLLGSFALTWGIVGSYLLIPDVTVGLFGEISGSHPLYFLATWSPAITGLALVVACTGLPGLRRFLSRLLLWRSTPGWWLFILLGLPLVFMAGSLLQGGALLATLPPQGVRPMLALLAMMLILGPVEELGWRGVAQPLLQRHMAPFWAGALIGVVWGIWHLPAFYLSGVVYEDWHFLPFFIGNVTLAILVTPLFNAARGSLLLPVLFHWQLINPFWPDAQPWDTWILVAVALVVVGCKRDSLFTRVYAVTDVVPERNAAAPDHPPTGIIRR